MTTVTYTREDDLVVALQEATKAMASNGRFKELARTLEGGDAEAAARVTEVADVYVAWLRRTTFVGLRFVAIREMDTGEIVSTTKGNTMAVDLDSSEEAVFDINARDDRGWLSKSALDLTVDGTAVTAEVVETEDPEAPNQLVVRSAAPGTASVTLSVPDDDTIGDAIEAFNVGAGGVATLGLGAPLIREQAPAGGEGGTDVPDNTLPGEGEGTEGETVPDNTLPEPEVDPVP
jgi:hypothetical protein